VAGNSVDIHAFCMMGHWVAVYSDEDIKRLIGCAKTILDAPKKEMKLVGADWRNEMKLVADGVPGEFRVFMRRNEDFPENFSIGLIYRPNDSRGDLTLIRCNGPHGPYNGVFDAGHPHWDFHVHKASEAAIGAGVRPEKNAEKTGEYASFEEAVHYFLSFVNVDKAETEKYFPSQRWLF
jgi:hypothetical protein